MFGHRQRPVWAGFQITGLLFFAGASACAQTAGTLTLVEGRLALIRGAAAYSAAQGVRLDNGDILAVDPKGQAQIEFQDGAILNLSQGTRAMLTTVARGQGARSETEIAVLSGWAKLAQKKSGAPYRFVTPLAQLASTQATAVLRTGGDFSEIFVESGPARFSEAGKRGVSGSARDVKSGEFVVRRGEQAATAAPRPSAEFVNTMPRHFRDNLPALLDRFKNSKAQPKREHEVSYAEVEVWLKANPSIRRNFVKRFQSRTKDAEFRSKLVENLRAHPEWDPVLFPEKYEPKDPKS